jgi:hypothetical protein
MELFQCPYSLCSQKGTSWRDQEEKMWKLEYPKFEVVVVVGFVVRREEKKKKLGIIKEGHYYCYC